MTSLPIACTLTPDALRARRAGLLLNALTNVPIELEKDGIVDDLCPARNRLAIVRAGLARPVVRRQTTST